MSTTGLLEKHKTGEWEEYFLRDDSGAEIAYAKWRIVYDPAGHYAELHNRARDGKPGTLRQTRRAFREQILPEIRAARCSHVVVGDLARNVDAARIKYWAFMGFEPLEELVGGHLFAVMEV